MHKLGILHCSRLALGLMIQSAAHRLVQCGGDGPFEPRGTIQYNCLIIAPGSVGLSFPQSLLH